MPSNHPTNQTLHLTGAGTILCNSTASLQRIASQNMWLDPEDYSVGEGGRKIYDLDMALKLDPQDVYFSHTLTAAISCQLHAGLEYHASQPMRFEEKQAILREFSAKHRPIRLEQIVKRPTTVSTTQPGGPAAH